MTVDQENAWRELQAVYKLIKEIEELSAKVDWRDDKAPARALGIIEAKAKQIQPKLQRIRPYIMRKKG